MNDNITGIIIASGISKEFGGNKSLLNLEGETLIERQSKLLKNIFSEVIIISNTPDDYTFLNLPVFKDSFENKGALASIHSGLKNSRTQKNFFISSDFPLMHEKMIEYICNFDSEYPATVYKANGKLEELVGTYSKKLSSTIESLLQDPKFEGAVPVLTLLKKVGATVILADKLDFYTIDNFVRINTPEDYQRLLDLTNYNSYLA